MEYNRADASRRIWLDAGQDLLREGGFQSVKLSSLCERTGRTSGSFYHHFSNMSGFLDQLAAYFGGEQQRLVVDQLMELPPNQRLRGLERASVEMKMFALHHAMRDWAVCHEPAAAAVRAADHFVMEFIRDAFVEAGVDVERAELSSEIVYAIAIVRLDTPWPRRSGSIVEETLRSGHMLRRTSNPGDFA